MLTAKRLLKIMGSNKKLYFFAMTATGLATLGSLIIPLIIKFTVDSVIGKKAIEAPQIFIDLIQSTGGLEFIAKNLWICSIAIILVTATQGVFSYLKGRWAATASENAARDLKNSLYDHLQKLPFEYHVKAQTGDLIQRCTSDVDTIRRFLSGQFIEMGRALFMIIFSISIIVGLNLKLTLVAIGLLPVIFLSALLFFKKIIVTFLKVDEKEGALSSVLQENLSGIRVVRAFGKQKYETERFNKHSAEFRDLSMNFAKLYAYFFMTSDLLSLGQMAAVIIAGAYMAVAGEISIGTFIVFTTYESMLVWPVRNMGRLLADMGKMKVAVERVYEILTVPEEQDTPNNVQIDLSGDILFNNVHFEYKENSPILNGLSFSIKQGETIAVLGGTGSGKSTIMHILLRLYDYKSGSITINGTELRNINKKWLRKKVGIVLQEPFLYSKTIMNNIKMAKSEATNLEVYDAAEVASVHEAIDNFESGYNTLVGEKGVTLSGGQKQRVAIARTLIKNSQILIFDDSLSAVDTETDAKIRKALRERNKNITTFIISQRITTLMQADRIFVLENGKLIDSGTHEELINREGLYSRIWNIQNMLEESEGLDNNL